MKLRVDHRQKDVFLHWLQGLQLNSSVRHWFSKFHTLCVSYCCLTTDGWDELFLNTSELVEIQKSWFEELTGHDSCRCLFCLVYCWFKVYTMQESATTSSWIVSLLSLRSNLNDNIIVQFFYRWLFSRSLSIFFSLSLRTFSFVFFLFSIFAFDA